MASKSLLLLGLAFAFVLLIASEVAAAKDQQASNQETQTGETNGVEDAKYGGGGGRYDNGGGGRYDNGGGGRYDNGGGGRYDNGGGGRYNNGGGGRGCRYGCCGGRGYYNRGHCRCCTSLQEATAFKQTQAQTHN